MPRAKLVLELSEESINGIIEYRLILEKINRVIKIRLGMKVRADEDEERRLNNLIVRIKTKDSIDKAKRELENLESIIIRFRNDTSLALTLGSALVENEALSFTLAEEEEEEEEEQLVTPNVPELSQQSGLSNLALDIMSTGNIERFELNRSRFNPEMSDIIDVITRVIANVNSH